MTTNTNAITPPAIAPPLTDVDLADTVVVGGDTVVVGGDTVVVGGDTVRFDANYKRSLHR